MNGLHNSVPGLHILGHDLRAGEVQPAGERVVAKAQRHSDYDGANGEGDPGEGDVQRLVVRRPTKLIAAKERQAHNQRVNDRGRSKQGEARSRQHNQHGKQQAKAVADDRQQVALVLKGGVDLSGHSVNRAQKMVEGRSFCFFVLKAKRGLT